MDRKRKKCLTQSKIAGCHGKWRHEKKRLRIWLQIRQQQEKSRDTRSYFVCCCWPKIDHHHDLIWMNCAHVSEHVFVCVCLHHKSLIWRLNQDQITWTSTADNDNNNIKYTITTRRRRQRRFSPNNNFIHLIYVNLPESRECFALREFFQRTHTNTASSIQIMSIKVEAEKLFGCALNQEACKLTAVI